MESEEMSNLTDLCDAQTGGELDLEAEIYVHFNYYLVVVLLPVVAMVGVVGNGISIFVYTRASMKSSVNTYLTVLAGCDLVISAASIFLFTMENLRHQDHLARDIYIGSVQVVFPLASVVQTWSVYMTVMATVDWFVALKMPRLHSLFSRIIVARGVSLGVGVFSFVYNFPHFLEIAIVTCFDPELNQTRPDVAPTPLRIDPDYTKFYYVYGYSVVMSIGPLTVLSVLTVLVALEIKRLKRRRVFWHRFISISLPFETEIPQCDDPMALIAVVILFISCNSLALLVNFLEMALLEELGSILNYLVDLSNFLVIFNSAGNFFLYIFTGPAFRTELIGSIETLVNIFKVNYNSTNNCHFEIALPDRSLAPLADLDYICANG